MRVRPVLVALSFAATVVAMSVVGATFTSSSTAEWLAAVGTVLAVAIALWLALQDRWRRPHLVLVSGAEKPWWKAGESGVYRLRLQVYNKGKYPAKAVRVRCELLQVGGIGSSGVVEFQNPDLVTGMDLSWYEAGRPGAATPVDLAPGASRYVGLLNVDGGSADLPANGPKYPLAEVYRAIITVTAENSDPLRRAVVLELPEGQGLDAASVAFEMPWPESDPLHDPRRTKRVSSE